MKAVNNLFLVGPMGAGKTTIGRVLAGQMGLKFLDSDREIERSTGADIAWIFDVEGESGFRARESRMIDLLSRRNDVVLATGGGAVLARQNRQRLQERGVVIYLCASIRQQLRQTRRGRKRPLLQTADPEQTIRELAARRDPLYREVADIVIETSSRSPRGVGQEIGRRLREAGWTPRTAGTVGPTS